MLDASVRFNRLTRFCITALAAIGSIAGLGACETIESISKEIRTPRPTNSEPVTLAGEPDIRVRIHRGVSSITLDGPQRLIVRASGASRAEVANGPFTVTSGSNGITLKDPAGRTKAFAYGADLEILPAGPGGTASQDVDRFVQINKVRYPGFAVIRPLWSGGGGAFDVIVEMPMESYLPGVLAHELYRDWPRQTFAAQAVAARTYALHERERARSENRLYDVESTDSDQVFGGLSTLTVALDATRETRGQVITWNGKFLRAYYSSQCGGRPASASKVWPTGKGYEFNEVAPVQGRQRAHYCQRGPLYRWEVTRKDDDVARRMRAWGARYDPELETMTRLRAIRVKSVNDAQRPNDYVLTDARGREYTLTAEELRAACNHAVPGLPPITRENRLSSGDVDVEVWADQVRFRGRGFGHGVGMCQWCARGMAEQGLAWPQMIETFFPYAKIEKAY